MGYFWIPDIECKLQDIASSLRKPKVKKKGSDDISAAVGPDPAEVQGSASNNFFHSLFNRFYTDTVILVLIFLFRCHR